MPGSRNRALHQSVAERAERGKRARAEAPRSSHADWQPAADRRAPVAWLEQQASSRVPELVPVRYGRMAASPFAFFRGAALVMAADLATTPTSGIRVQICGDAHLANFGLFASPERRLMFDINDFDETLPGPWEWDVKRLAASLEVAGRARALSRKQRREVVAAAVGMYRNSMRTFATMGDLDVWYAHAAAKPGLPRLRQMLDAESFAQVRRVIEKAMTKTSAEALSRLSEVRDGERRLVSDPPLLVPVDQLFTPDEAAKRTEVVHQVLREARRSLPDERRQLLDGYRFVEMARKVVGVGSVGTRCWVVLLVGRDDSDVLLLQAKEAEASVLEEFLERSSYAQHGQRVVEGQRMMQAASDIFLCWATPTETADGRRHDYYLRQLHDWKGSWDPATMNHVGLLAYGQLCAWTLARAHARTGDRVAIASYLGSSDAFDRALVTFAATYADQNERDHSALEQAIRDGEVVAQAGV